ncbi:MAG: class I SAM-dependent methyltransferase, partial [Acidimicrobiales bacterium]
MRDHVRSFVAEAVDVMGLKGPVLEVGARAAEGQEELADLRPLFEGSDYVGVDIQEGPGVDRVEDVHRLDLPDESFGTALALDTLEHVADPRRAVSELWRVLRPGGVALITSVMFFPIHAHPWDYWRFTPEGFRLLLEPFETSLVMAYGWELMPETVFGVGVKGGFEGLAPGVFPQTERLCDEWGNGRPLDLGPLRLGAREM